MLETEERLRERREPIHENFSSRLYDISDITYAYNTEELLKRLVYIRTYVPFTLHETQNFSVSDSLTNKKIYTKQNQL